jgi:hypothetical protein
MDHGRKNASDVYNEFRVQVASIIVAGAEKAKSGQQEKDFKMRAR